jgi:hypothetical protein
VEAGYFRPLAEVPRRLLLLTCLMAFRVQGEDERGVEGRGESGVRPETVTGKDVLKMVTAVKEVDGIRGRT